MYYKEEIINNILCCKHTLRGEWIPLSQEELTKRLTKLKLENQILRDQLERSKRKLHEPI